MKKLTSRITITKSLSTITHTLLKVLLPLLAFFFVSVELAAVAFAVVVIAKWQVLAVKSRYWGINFRTNIVDIIVGLSFVEFMSQVDFYARLLWLLGFMAWVLYVKRLSTYKGMILQAMFSQALGISALLYNNQSISLGLMTFGVWFVAYFSARHALSAFEEDHSAALAHVWGLFAVQLAWTLGHWQIWFWFVHQIVLILTILASSLILIYTLQKQESLRNGILRQISATTSILILAIIVLSDWQDKTI